MSKSKQWTEYIPTTIQMAVANTWAIGINPAAVKDLLKIVEEVVMHAENRPTKQDYIEMSPEMYEKAKAAIKKSKV